MFLLNQQPYHAIFLTLEYLHPIMFLLNHDCRVWSWGIYKDLHPIMFLLNLFSDIKACLITAKFTSHYVPIKSFNSSTDKPKLLTFTSHYVPIKSISSMIVKY